MGWFSASPAPGQARHPCAGAGRWFPANPRELRQAVADYVDDAETTPPPGRVVAVIVPHAGYLYCGPVAGEAFHLLKDRKDIRRVIILAFSHSYPVQGISVLDVEAYETPLGDVPVDRDAVKSLLARKPFTTIERAHVLEHSDENQLPFLQTVLGSDFKLVSLFVGHVSESDLDRAAAAIQPLLDPHTVLVVSSDFTHYGEAYGFAPFKESDARTGMRKLDHGAIEKICEKDHAGFRDYIQETGATICGVQPISLLLKVLPPEAEGHSLTYQTSADVMGGDYELAVGYAAIAFTVEEDTSASSTAKAAKAEGASAAGPSKTANPGPATELQQLDLVTPEEQDTLLRLARTSIERAYRETAEEEQLDLKGFQLTETLRKPLGAFVTLTLAGNLRGCIGYITGRKPLYQTILENARNAAFRDPRFTPLAADELPSIHIEISVLSPLEEIQPEDVVVGRDGLVLSKEGYSGVLLPQVPVEYGWTREEFLDHLCRKAGLPRGSWRNGATLQRFGAQVFGEHDH